MKARTMDGLHGIDGQSTVETAPDDLTGEPIAATTDFFDPFESVRTASFTDQELAARIHQRICMHTSGRVRDLTVVVTPDQIEIHGRCATFYTKQLAQHAAMGVLDGELLVNLIDVRVGR